MPERTSYAPGSFSWVDLTTSDLEAAKTFYTGLLGWEYKTEETPMGPYVMAYKDDKAVAGLGNQPDEQKEMGIPSFWNSYVSVESADESASKAAELGGTVLMGPMDAVEAGRMAFIAAPGGETFGVWEAKNHIGAGLTNEPGTLTWNELATRDINTAKTFYAALFDWKVETGPNPSGTGEYTIASVGEDQNAGMLTIDENWPDHVPNYWGIYLSVTDVEDTTAKAKDLGGEVVMPSMTIPDVGTMVVLRDPTGAIFSPLQAAPQLDES